MIENIEIKNFRRFQKLSMADCTLINVIVGESGSGKTALLEAVFLALCNNPQKALLLRQWRGNEPEFSGPIDAIVSAFYGELFFKFDTAQKASIRLRGTGPEVRSLTISRGRGDIRIPKGAKSVSKMELVAPIIFEWVDSKGKRYPASTKVTDRGLEFESTGEVMPNWFFFAAQQPVYARETAGRFSDLRKSGRDREFIDAFRAIYPWVSDISVETSGGVPVLHAKIDSQLLPLTAVSGGMNRVAAVLLAIAHRERGIVLVDEMENGVFHQDQEACTKAILGFARRYQCQIFVSSHGREWLQALVAGAGKQLNDITLWRLERDAPSPLRFSGKTFKAGVDYGTEVRG